MGSGRRHASASGNAADGWSVNGAGREAREAWWSQLWRTREIIAYLAARDLTLRYRQAVLGALWVLAQPVGTVVAFTLIFRHLARVGSEGVPYPLFALTGLVIWTYFASATGRAADVLVGNPNLVTKIYFPRLAAPAAGLLSPLVDFAVSLVVLVALAAWYGVWPGLDVLGAILWFPMLVAATFGVSLWLSALNVRYRDVQHAVGPLLQMLLLASPVAYSGSVLTGWPALLYAVNPMVGIISVGRWSLLGTAWPGWSLLVSALGALALLLSGLAYFRRAEPTFADVI